VNHIAVTPRGDLLAAADDSGQVAVVSLASHALVKTLKRQHTNIASCVAWRPNRAGELLSAGLDSRVVAWDAPNGRVRHVCSWLACHTPC
jgi:WD40 repeat protein